MGVLGQQLSSADVQNVAWALGSMYYMPPAGWLQCLVDGTAERLERLQWPALVYVLWAYGKFGHAPAGAYMERVLEVGLGSLHLLVAHKWWRYCGLLLVLTSLRQPTCPPFTSTANLSPVLSPAVLMPSTPACAQVLCPGLLGRRAHPRQGPPSYPQLEP